ncbi:MAG TPA: hypothetical protein VLK33_17395 [Terriglobales bacterium]|nr:hypothetical protein [Terriglobales bacterium]
MSAVLLLAAACNKPQAKTDDAPAPMARSVIPPEQQVVQKTFTVEKHESFELTIPPHCLHPRLHGTFKSFHYGAQGNRLSDEASNIDVLVLDEQQYKDFVDGRGDEMTRSIQNVHEQRIDWAMPSSFENPRKFYLIFNNATGKPKTKIVEADLTLSFD